jgi:LuxR family maltose regulon positive regulatory protein
VILVCAPAGSGKSVLVHSWVEAGGPDERVAWVSVERGEPDAQRFWLSVIDACAGDGGGDQFVERVSPSPIFRGEPVVERLLSDLALLEEPIVLVVDDLHELGSADALRLLERFLTRLPPQVRVVLASREDPGLGLHRLRLAGGLTELRGPDLRFSQNEARQLLEAAGVTLSDAGVALLHERTEGWAAGLRLAAISLAEHADPERFVSEFSGSERAVAGYLLAEVLERQPKEVRELLLRTSVLERVSGPLADALSGGSGSERILQQLEDANAFVTSLDAGRSWFRYHHLFADLLRLELRRSDPASVGPLHRTAAQWYEEHGHPVDAIRHAQAAKDWPGAARLLAESSIGLRLDGRQATLHALLAAFPAEAPAENAELALVFAADRVLDGAFEEAAAYIAAAEKAAGAVPPERRWQLDLERAGIRLSLARRQGDLEAATEAMRSLEAAWKARPASDVAFSNDHRATALMNLGIAELWSIRFPEAQRHLEDALRLARRIERPYLEVGCLAHLAIAALLTGLSAAVALQRSEEAVAIAETHGWATEPVAAAAFGLGGQLLVRLGRFAEAERWLDRAERALHPGEPGTELVLRLSQGLLQMGRGRLEEALAAFRAGEEMQALLAGEHALTAEGRNRILQIHVRTDETVSGPAALARVASLAGDRAGARITTAAVRLAQGNPRQAVEELAPVIAREVTALHPAWAALEASLFDAAAREQLGDRRAAEESIERALDLAEPDGAILPFALVPVRGLLERHPRDRTAHASLLSTILDLLAGSSPEEFAPLLDELSEAELRVLRYLPSNLKAPEIASELYVSANTVRTHLRHIYAKLDAHTRSEAVSRARELGLLGPTSIVR